MSYDLEFEIIYSEFDEIRGPVIRSSYPEDIEENLGMKIAAKAIGITSNDQNINTQSSAFIPFADLNKKGIVRAFQWSHQNLRGSIGIGAVVLLFKEEDDLIFYKYIKDLEDLFTNAAVQIGNLKPNTIKNDILKKQTKAIYENFKKKLTDLQNQEQTWKEEGEEFPEEETSEINKFKVVVCGDPGCGKTTSILRFTDQAFRRTYLPTMGVNITRKDLRVSKTPVFLILWDLAGEIKFKYMRHQLYEGGRAFILMYDVTRPKTFGSIKGWFKDIKTHLKSKKKSVFLLCGNKIDLKEERKLSTEDGLKLANHLGIPFFETSALTGENICDEFQHIATKLVEYMENK